MPSPGRIPFGTGRGGSGPLGIEVVCSLLLGDIQSASDTGLKTGFAAATKPVFRPVELVRGGMAFGEG